MRFKLFYIGGHWVDPQAPHDLDVIDPSTELDCATISLGSAEDVDRAIAAAQTAFVSWSSTLVETRIARLERLLTLCKAACTPLARAMSQEMRRAGTVWRLKDDLDVKVISGGAF